MKTAVEPLEGNKVKLSIEVEEGEFDKAIDAAFRKIAHEVRIPGFRPGKAPRRLLEARVGIEAARQEALREALPDYYARALKDAELDAIAPPEIDITGGEAEGALVFDAVVEIRPQVQVIGYGGLRVAIPNPEVDEADVDRQLDRIRNQFAELEAVDRPIAAGDNVTVDIAGTRDGEALPGMSAEDYLYEVGSGTFIPELDEHLLAAEAGATVSFDATVPGSDGDTVTFEVAVKDVKQKVLPPVTDEWASEASEFDTVEELRNDIRKRLSVVKRVQAQMALQDEAVKALVELVDDEAPEPLVNQEVERRLHDLQHRLEAQGAGIVQYLEATGTSQQELLDGLRGDAVAAVKADLALRAVAQAEALEVTDEDIEAQIARIAEQVGQKPAQVRRQLERADQLPAVRSDVKKAKALDWLLEHVEVVDEEGQPIDRASLTASETPGEDPHAGHDHQAAEGEGDS